MPLPLMAILGGAATAAFLPSSINEAVGLGEDLGFDPLGRMDRRSRAASAGVVDLGIGELESSFDLTSEAALADVLGATSGLDFEGLGGGGFGEQLRQTQLVNELTLGHERELGQIAQQARFESGLEDLMMRLL